MCIITSSGHTLFALENLEFFLKKNTDILIYSNNELRFTRQISSCFLLINSCLNPVVLFCTSSTFRQQIKRYLKCFRKQVPLLLISNLREETEFVITFFIFFSYD
jgi:hypothetical protein